MGNVSSMKPLYRRLRSAGLPTKYVREHLLPFWWEDGLASNRVSYLHALGSIVKHIGLPLQQLLDESAELSPDITAPAEFKRRNNTERSDFTWAEALAISAAQHAVACLHEYQPPINPDPATIRNFILRRGHPWVTLSSLLDFCWDHGIPVIHLSRFPTTKMEGLAIYTDDGPAIVLTYGHHSHAWLSFHLAHELGHILLRHVKGKDYVDDESIRLGNEEQKEAEANRFAVGLLTGNEDAVFKTDGFISDVNLARAVRTTGEKYKVDPGVILLNYIYNKVRETGNEKMWGFGNKVLKLISPTDNAPMLIRQVMKDRLDLRLIPDDSADVLLRLCNIES